MTNIYKIFSALAFATILSSCTKTIVIDLKDVDKKLVVEAEIGNKPKQCIVKLSKSVSYATDNSFPNVIGAVVTISDNVGHAYSLMQDTNGVYRNDTVIGVPGNIYSLKIVADGKTYTSICKMPMPIVIDSINNSTQVFFGNSVKLITVHFNDDGATNNYYRYFKTVNGVRKGQSEIFSDLFISGISTSIRDGSRSQSGQDSLSFATGNTIGATLQNVDKAVYLYFNSKDQNTNGQSGAPANPQTNIVGGALGYFNAYTADYKETVMK